MNIYINDANVEVNEGISVLMAAASAGVKIPALCCLKDVFPGGVCGICLAEADGKTVKACNTKVTEGMRIVTDSPEIKAERKERLLKLAENHRFDCEFCPRCMDCEFIRILNENGIYDFEYQRRANESHGIKLAGNIVFDDTLCVGCGRCAAACRDGSVTLKKTEKGLKACVNAEIFTGSGECAAVCPTAAFSIEEKEEIKAVRRAVHDRKCYAVISPDAAAVFGEFLFDEAGKECSGRLAAVMRRLGFKKVFLAGKRASVSEITKAVKAEDDAVVVSVSTITGPVRPGADIDITVNTLLTIFRRACVSRTTMVQTWRKLADEEYDKIEVNGSGEASYSFGGAMPHRDCYYSAGKNLTALREEALEKVISAM